MDIHINEMIHKPNYLLSSYSFSSALVAGNRIAKAIVFLMELYDKKKNHYQKAKEWRFLRDSKKPHRIVIPLICLAVAEFHNVCIALACKGTRFPGAVKAVASVSTHRTRDTHKGSLTVHSFPCGPESKNKNLAIPVLSLLKRYQSWTMRKYL